MTRCLSVPAVALAAVLVLASCASIQRSVDEGAVRQVADLVNSGQPQKLASMSVAPFLLDGEIIPLADDVASFWGEIVKAGFRVEGAALESGEPVAKETYARFAGTMEVKSYFSLYAKDARVLEMTTSTGKRILLLARRDWFSWKLLGFKGPF